MKTKKNLIIKVALIIGIVFFISIMYFSVMSEGGDGAPITIYKSMYCGCCEGYLGELKNSGFNIKVENVDDLDSIKSGYNIPEDMGSCHTVIIGDYFVEGHVPLEAINKLLTEKPDIDGIALPDMPSGTPGMPGEKTEDWVIYSIKDGVSSEFMII